MAIAPSGRAKNVSARNRRIGTWWIASPFISLSTVLVVWSVASAALGDAADGSTREAVGMWINVILGFIGILCFVGIAVCIPIGIRYLNRQSEDGGEYDQRSGLGGGSAVPPEVLGWNWAAAFLGVIWAAYHRVWKAFFGLIPVVGWVWWIVMGINGNRWAWQKNRWPSVEEFQRSQRRWRPWGIAMMLVSIAVVTLIAVSGGGATPGDREFANGSSSQALADGVIQPMSPEDFSAFLAIEQEPQKFDWVTYSPPSGEFTVEFPAEPEPYGAPGNGDPILKSWRYGVVPSEERGDAYLVIDQQLVKAFDGTEEVFSGLLSGFMQGLEGYRVVSWEPAEVATGVARDALITDGNGSYIQLRLLTVSSHSYAIIVYNDQRDRANYLKFIESFRVNY